jgi:hypothetical protein
MACDARRDRTARRGGRRVDREAMELATWYHDANCEIARDYNEDRSAQLAREMLSSSPIRDEVARLVLVTKTHKCAPTCRCSAASRAGIGPTRRRSGRLRPRAPRRARPPQSHRRDRRTEGLVEFTCITLVSLVDNFLHMSVFRTSVCSRYVGRCGVRSRGRHGRGRSVRGRQAELTSSTPVRPLEPDHTTADDQHDGSRVTGDCHARF